MNITQTLNQLFLKLESKDEFSGVVLITKGEAELYSGAFVLFGKLVLLIMLKLLIITGSNYG